MSSFLIKKLDILNTWKILNYKGLCLGTEETSTPHNLKLFELN